MSAVCTVSTVYGTLVAFAGLSGRAFHTAFTHTRRARVPTSVSSAVGYFSCAKALAADRGSASVTLGAEALAVAVAPLTVVVDPSVTPGALEVALVTAGGTVIDRLLECSGPKRLYRDEHSEHCYQEHRGRKDDYSFLCKLHFLSLLRCDMITGSNHGNFRAAKIIPTRLCLRASELNRKAHG